MTAVPKEVIRDTVYFILKHQKLSVGEIANLQADYFTRYGEYIPLPGVVWAERPQLQVVNTDYQKRLCGVNWQETEIESPRYQTTRQKVTTTSTDWFSRSLSYNKVARDILSRYPLTPGDEPYLIALLSLILGVSASTLFTAPERGRSGEWVMLSVRQVARELRLNQQYVRELVNHLTHLGLISQDHLTRNFDSRFISEGEVAALKADLRNPLVSGGLEKIYPERGCVQWGSEKKPGSLFLGLTPTLRSNLTLPMYQMPDQPEIGRQRKREQPENGYKLNSDRGENGTLLGSEQPENPSFSFSEVTLNWSDRPETDVRLTSNNLKEDEDALRLISGCAINPVTVVDVVDEEDRNEFYDKSKSDKTETPTTELENRIATLTLGEREVFNLWRGIKFDGFHERGTSKVKAWELAVTRSLEESTEAVGLARQMWESGQVKRSPIGLAISIAERQYKPVPLSEGEARSQAKRKVTQAKESGLGGEGTTEAEGNGSYQPKVREEQKPAYKSAVSGYKKKGGSSSGGIDFSKFEPGGKYSYLLNRE